jgi:hypothetical protein
MDGSNGVVTNGNGGLVVYFGKNPSGESQLVLNSIAIHELNHIKDAYNQNNTIANGQPVGMILAPDTLAEQLDTEIAALNAQIAYLRKVKACPDTSNYDGQRVQIELLFAGKLLLEAVDKYNKATVQELMGPPQRIW